jgi:hypothetical protein
MSNIPTGRGFQRSRVSGITNRLNSAQSSVGSTIPSSTDNLPPPVNSNNDATQQNVIPKSSSGVVR